MNHQDLSGAASGSGYGGYCPEGVPVELGLLTILAAFGVAFGVLYRALTATTATRRKKRSEDEVLSCEAESVEDLIGCKVGQLGAANPGLGKIVDLLWHGELTFFIGYFLSGTFSRASPIGTCTVSKSFEPATFASPVFVVIVAFSLSLTGSIDFPDLWTWSICMKLMHDAYSLYMILLTGYCAKSWASQYNL